MKTRIQGGKPRSGPLYPPGSGFLRLPSGHFCFSSPAAGRPATIARLANASSVQTNQSSEIGPWDGHRAEPPPLKTFFCVQHDFNRPGRETNSPRTRRQKLHNNRLRSATPIVLPILGPPPPSPQRRIPISAPLPRAEKGGFEGEARLCCG